MANTEKTTSRRIPWYLWPLVPTAAITAFVVFVPLAIVAAASIPFSWLYPERHVQLADVSASDEEKARVARWRSAYKRLSFTGRFSHAIKKTAKRRRASRLSQIA